MMTLNDTVTVFNSRLVEDEFGAKGEEVFYSTLLKNVLYVEDEVGSMGKFGVENNGIATCYIVENDVSCDKTYIKVDEFQSKTDLEVTKYYTLYKGDYICLGDETSPTVLSSSDINNLKNQHSDMKQIMGVSAYLYGNLSNIKVIAK